VLVFLRIAMRFLCPNKLSLQMRDWTVLLLVSVTLTLLHYGAVAPAAAAAVDLRFLPAGDLEIAAAKELLFPVDRVSLNITSFDSALLQEVNKTWVNTTRHLSESGGANASHPIDHVAQGLCFTRILQEAADRVVLAVEAQCTPVDVQDGNCSDVVQGAADRALLDRGWTSPAIEVLSEASQLPFHLDSLNSTGSGGVGPGDYDILIGIAKLVAERIKPEVERAAALFHSDGLAGISSALQPVAGNSSATNLYIIIFFGKDSTQHCLGT
jgi:hypothetical protein